MSLLPALTLNPTLTPHTKNQNFSFNKNRATNQSLSIKYEINKPHIDPTVLWTSKIAHHCKNGKLPEAVSEFTAMRLAEVEPNHVTFITLLSACAHFPSQSFNFGASIHAYVRKLGCLDMNDVMVGTSLIGMYSKCRKVRYARLVFDGMDEKNSVSWNAMIDGYTRNGEIESAVEVFDHMPNRDAISWTALIGGFVKKGRFEEALELFREMQLSGVRPDYVTIISVLAACANLGTYGLGLWMNRYIAKQYFNDNIRVSNSLIDMYSRCGCIEFARQVFMKMPVRSLVSWNSIIIGFAVNGHAEEALEFFNLMEKVGFKPDGVSFTGALTACSHAGLVTEGLQFFDRMKRFHRIKPRIEHYGCIVDIYSRAGRLEDALDVIENMPMKPNEVVLGSLLAACKGQADLAIAERVVNYLVELDPNTDSNYVLLANIYAGIGRWDGANKVRRAMKDLGIRKKPGFSSIDIDCCSYEFVAADKTHPDSEGIYAMLDHLSLELRVCGYVPETNVLELYERG